MYNVPFTAYHVEPGVLSMTEKNIGNRWANEGLITMSWNEKTGIDVESDKVLFTLTFKAEKDGKLFEVMAKCNLVIMHFSRFAVYTLMLSFHFALHPLTSSPHIFKMNSIILPARIPAFTSIPYFTNPQLCILQFTL